MVGAIGSVLGLGLGIVLGQGAVRLVTQTINDLYFVDDRSRRRPSARKA